MKVSTTAATTGSADASDVPERAISTMAVAMAPGPASSGMASGTMATSSFTTPSSSSVGLVRVEDGRARSMSRDVIKSRMPPATRKAPSDTAKTWKMTRPKTAKNSISPHATRQARRAVLRICCLESPAVIARNSGTTPMGSTTKKMADSDTRKVDTTPDIDMALRP